MQSKIVDVVNTFLLNKGLQSQNEHKTLQIHKTIEIKVEKILRGLNEDDSPEQIYEESEIDYKK